MNEKTNVKGQNGAEAKAEAAVAGRAYRRPEVHDLGKLELVQGNVVLLFRDANTRYNMMF
jgi:hypothetical protein